MLEPTPGMESTPIRRPQQAVIRIPHGAAVGRPPPVEARVGPCPHALRGVQRDRRPGAQRRGDRDGGCGSRATRRRGGRGLVDILDVVERESSMYAPRAGFRMLAGSFQRGGDGGCAGGGRCVWGWRQREPLSVVGSFPPTDEANFLPLDTAITSANHQGYPTNQSPEA
jgi:hypothetical protein